MTTALIFGANGQDGYYLARLCREFGIEPVGVSRSGDWIHADVSSSSQVRDLMQQQKPEYIFHLAGNSTTGPEALQENLATIANGTVNILEASAVFCPLAKIFITGSGVQFKNVGKPISESDPFEASSAYALARIQSVYTARYYRSRGMRVYVGYLFHHESTHRPKRHVSQLIAQAAQRIAAGSTEKIQLGDIAVRKEWVFAGDAVRGMFALMNQEQVFEAAIGSGIAYSIEDWLNECFQIIGRDWRPHVALLEGFQPEYRCLVSNPETMRTLGWLPTVTFPDLAQMMVRG
ncbi:MAG: GDP-mannose 4,6-dehydratase [Candidatus Peregrinibacteria bacterium]